MKIALFFDLYGLLHENKDLGQITLGLIETGVESGIITVDKTDLENYVAKFPLYKGQLSEFYDKDFWLKNNSDVILAYPLQGDFYSPMIEKMKAGGKKVILKLDSDGKIAYPLERDYLRIPLRERFTLRNLISMLWWRLSFKSLKYKRHSKVAAEFTKQVQLSDGVIIESPDALANLDYFLTAWGRADLVKKTYFIPNPVRPAFTEASIGKKEKVAVSYGRWDDFRQKNTAVMVASVVEFLKQRTDYRFVIFGKGTNTVENLLREAPEGVRSRIQIYGFVEDSKVVELLGGARIFFVPSRWESFSIASGEALCMGCSIVGTPVEALRYLSMQGFSGTTAATFDKAAILAALLQDVEKWDSGSYDPQKTAAFWRPKLDRRTVAKSIENLARVS